jgi:hypothetical protein
MKHRKYWSVSERKFQVKRRRKDNHQVRGKPDRNRQMQIAELNTGFGNL